MAAGIVRTARPGLARRADCPAWSRLAPVRRGLGLPGRGGGVALLGLTGLPGAVRPGVDWGRPGPRESWQRRGRVRRT
jgi:hypothetical protein